MTFLTGSHAFSQLQAPGLGSGLDLRVASLVHSGNLAQSKRMRRILRTDAALMRCYEPQRFGL